MDRITLRVWYASLALLALILASLACNAPGAGSGTGPLADGQTPTFFIDPTLLTPGITQTGEGIEPTATLAQEAIPSPTGCGYWSQFLEDATIPDGTEIVAGTSFEKTWRFRNNGCLDWPATTQLVFWDGDQMGGPDAVDVPATAFNQERDVTVPLIAPDEPGEYTGYWQLRTPDGASVGPYVYVQIEVIAPPLAPTATPGTATPSAAWAPFLGTWNNESAATDNIVKVEIRLEANTLIVRRWDRCGANVCDRGVTTTPTTDASDGVLGLIWTGVEEGIPAYKTETQRLAVLLDGRLQITGNVDFIAADQEDFSYTEYFVKER